jgi:mannonate dehydratase
VDISSPGFGIQEENHFPDSVREMMSGVAEIRRGYLYGSGKPGLGIDINETIAAKYPIRFPEDGGPYSLDRAMDGSVVKP